MAASSENKLIEACKSGSQSAFRELIKRHYREVFSMACYWTQNREAALDISQEVFIRIIRNLNKYQPGKSFKGWLYIITKNLSINYIQRERKRRILFSDFFFRKNSHFDVPDSPVSVSDRTETIQLIRQAMGQLKNSEQDIILLKDFEDFTYREISELLDLPLGTVMSRLFTARKKLAKILQTKLEVK